jgi:hypothetical protein
MERDPRIAQQGEFASKMFNKVELGDLGERFYDVQSPELDAVLREIALTAKDGRSRTAAQMTLAKHGDAEAQQAVIALIRRALESPTRPREWDPASGAAWFALCAHRNGAARAPGDDSQ